MRYAIIQSGGKQYKAVEGQAIEVERLELEIGKKVDLTDVLLVSDGEDVQIGTPNLAGAKVAATVLAQDKGPKVTVFHYKPKIRYRVKTGHRQPFTRLQIDSIELKGAPAKNAEGKEEPKAEAKPAAKARRTASKPKAAAKKPAAKKPATKKPAAKKPATKKPAAKK